MTSAKLRQLADDASPATKANIERALSPGVAATVEKKSGIRLPRAAKMTKAEQEYGSILRHEFPGCDVRFEPFSFRLASGARYTPDWIVMRDDEILLCVETKGGFRLQSAARSHLAFKCAISEWPALRWRYAEKKEGKWIVNESTPATTANA